MQYIMLDLETFGTSPEAAIVSIGAVKFSSAALGEEFHARIAFNDPLLGKIDGHTVAWWLKQSDAARTALLDGERVSLTQALEEFTAWVGPDPKGFFLWSCGPTFDSVLLQSAYRRCGLPWPFKYDADRCFRTIRDLGIVAFRLHWDSKAVAHDALADAKKQAQFVIDTIRALDKLQENLR